MPVTATTSKTENEVYRHREATDEEFENICAFYRQVLDEGKDLCVGAQGNYSGGVFIHGELHPSEEKGPIHFHDSVRQMVMDHWKREEQQGGRQVWPAVPKVTGEMKTDKLEEEERFCSQLEAASCMARPELA
ncbi:hypothetical protein BBP40_011331 [Aspergillus hancockii]|nr:hypothetical protein BBP40_011331 [Aspergillus hancockii]